MVLECAKTVVAHNIEFDVGVMNFALSTQQLPQLNWPEKFCKNCGGKVVPTVYEGHPDWTHDTGDGTTSFLCHARNIAEVDA